MNAPGHTQSTTELDPMLHQAVRTRLVAFLATRGEATFSELKTALEITDGNLDAHIRKLTTAGYLRARKLQGSGRPQTLYILSRTGKHAFEQYVQRLNALLNPSDHGDESAIANELKGLPRPV